MGQWYESDRRLFREEREALAAASPLLRLAVVGPHFKLNDECELKKECAIVHGTYDLHIPESSRQIEYGIVLVFPEHYPKRPPELFCNDPKLPIGNIDRHIMHNGHACLGVQAEIGMRWSQCPTIIDFLENLIAPFLAWQAYYDVHQEPPPWGQRSHFAKGILEFYAELFGMQPDASVVNFIRLLARKNRPKGHESCPCHSGKRLRNCHRDLLYKTRESVAWQDAAHDLQVLRGLNDIANSVPLKIAPNNQFVNKGQVQD